MDALRAFAPTASQPWDAPTAAHLARRAGFGARPEEISELVALGPVDAVERFVGEPERDEALEAELESLGPELDLAGMEPGAYGGQTFDLLRRRWIYRMVRGRTPLTEKLALFWHDHFACQSSKVVRTWLCHQQLELFRAHALGSFRSLLGAVASNPAMLVFLDNRLSEKSAPNENWARELMELFTLGVDRYSQRDVTELARVFTGWTTERADSTEFVYDPELHDEDDKSLLGQVIAGRSGEAGRREGHEALELLLGRRDCALFLADKLARWFAQHEPPAEVVEALADTLVENDYQLRPTLRRLFRSAWFYAPEQRFALYKNPVELLVGACRLLDLNNPHLFHPERHAHAMGMRLFEPPSVAGWDHGPEWVRTGTVAPRLNLALDLSEQAHASRSVAGRCSLDLDALAGTSESGQAADELVDALGARLLQRPLEDEQRAALIELVDSYGTPPSDEREARRFRRARVRAALHLCLACPQFTLA